MAGAQSIMKILHRVNSVFANQHKFNLFVLQYKGEFNHSQSSITKSERENSVGTQSSGVSYAMLMRPCKAKTAVHGY